MTDDVRPTGIEADPSYLRGMLVNKLLSSHQETRSSLQDLHVQVVRIAMQLENHLKQASKDSEALQTVVSTVSTHSIKISMLDRMGMALWGAVFVLAAGGAGWVVAHLTGHVVR